MQLNHDCIRDILLYIEDNTNHPNDIVNFNKICATLEDKYDRDVVHYHINQLTQAKFISTKYADNRPYYISPLTWEGHGYLDNIRNKPVWEKLKEIGLSSMSLDVAKDLAKEIIISFAKSKLHLE